MATSGVSLPDEVRRLMPMTPAVFYVMLALSPGAKHGYAIMQEAGVLSDGGFRMGPATLYSTIQRLVALDVIHEIASGELASGEEAGSRRRYYELTATGRKLLELEVARLNNVVQVANARMGHPRWTPLASEE